MNNKTTVPTRYFDEHGGQVGYEIWVQDRKIDTHYHFINPYCKKTFERQLIAQYSYYWEIDAKLIHLRCIYEQALDLRQRLWKENHAFWKFKSEYIDPEDIIRKENICQK